MKRKLLLATLVVAGAVGMRAQTDVTSKYLTNPSFEKGDMTGWVAFGANGDDTPVPTAQEATKMTNADGNYLCNFQWWCWSADGNNPNGISQTISGLPAGTYQITAVLGSKKNWSLTLDVNGVKQTETIDEELENDVFASKNFSVTVTVNGTEDLVIKAITAASQNGWEECFMRADNFKLYRLPTYVTSTYITNADFESTTYTTPYHPNNDRDITQPEGWTLTYTGGVNYDSSILKETQATYNNISSQVTIPGTADGRGNQTYAVRFHNNGNNQLITLAQNEQVLPKGKYILSGLFRTQNQNEIEVGFYFGTEYKEENRVKFEAGNSAWRNLTTTFESDGTEKTTIGVFFKHKSNNQMVAGVDNITLEYKNVNVSLLANLLAQGNKVYAKTNDASLSTALANAQNVYDGINDTPDHQSLIDDAISSLQTAIVNAKSGYTWVATGDDISSLVIDNNGFDFDINFTSKSESNISSVTEYPTYGWTPTVGANSTGATIEYGYSKSLNSGNATAPETNADGGTTGGALFVCVGWNNTVVYKSGAYTFPAGSYRITYRAYNGNTKNTTATEIIPLVGFVPTEGDAIINSATETFTNQAWTTHTYDFVLTSETEGKIQIGMKPTTNTYSYNAPELFIDDVTIQYYNELELARVDLYTEIQKASAITNASINVGNAAFQIPTSAVTTLNSAIETAQGVYDNNSATVSNVENGISDLQTAEETYANVELNVPSATQAYNIVFNCEGHDYTGYALTLIPNPAQTQGLYGLKYLAPANVNLAQAFYFVHTTGNKYKVFAVDTDGNDRYITTQAEGYGTTWYEGIRTIEDASKAMEVEIRPNGEGLYLLWNTGANKPLGHNGNNNNDLFTNNTANFQFVATSKPSITINTTAAGWGTTILPFGGVEIPAGVKAYSCSAVESNGTTLTLVKVSALEANEPYIIEGAWNETLTGDAQGTALTYTEGLLTGVYAATPAPVDSYVLQKNGDKVAFYQVETGKQPTVGANRAYLTYEAPAGDAKARAFYFDDDTATAIATISALTSGKVEAIYTVGGTKVNGLQKGINIVKMQNGETKKIIVK